MTKPNCDDYEPTPEELNRAARKLKRNIENSLLFMETMMAMKPKPKPAPIKPKGGKC